MLIDAPEGWTPEVDHKVDYKVDHKVDYKSGANQLNSSESRVIELLTSDSRMTIPQLCDKMGLSRSGINKILASLRTKGVLERVGANKNGYWKVNI